MIPIWATVEWESALINGPGAWRRSELMATPAEEILQHIILARRADVNEKNWAINISSFAERKERNQKEILGVLDSQFWLGTRIIEPTRLVDEKTRILMIGSELNVHGDRWAEIHPDEIEWLEENEITKDEAIAAHREWLAEELANPFWTPAKESKRNNT